MERPQRIALVIAVALGIGVGALIVAPSLPLCPIGVGQAEWELGLWATEEMQPEDDAVELDVEIVLSGHVSQTTVRNVTIAFEDANGTAYRTVDVGTISGYTKINESVRLDRAPHRIRIELGSIENGNDDAEYWIRGLERTDGTYEPFTQEHRPC